MKILNGKDLANFIKERQAHQVASLNVKPKLLIIRDSDNPVITKYVNLKIKYGEDIGIEVEDYLAKNSESIAAKINEANEDPAISGIILQLPILEKDKTDELCNLIAPTKDVDGLGQHAKYDSATATAILWLLAGYDIKLENKKIAIVGRGKLVGAPLYRIFQTSNYNVSLFHRGDDLTNLKSFDIIISATGVPGLISSEFISPGTTLVDAGTASEDGVIKGDFAPELYTRKDLTAITPVVGGVGPLTITCLFDHLLQSAA
jgi:methylenetetrahydrofolate dehydrogenase (NADP+)/methenyltetrahydrofolate cyclohydrolase